MSTGNIERTCPACNGTGGEGVFKNWIEGKGGGVCSTCHGTGKVVETIHIRDNVPNSDEGDLGCLLMILMLIQMLIIILVFAVAIIIPVTYGIIKAIINQNSSRSGRRTFGIFITVVLLIVSIMIIGYLTIVPYAFDDFLYLVNLENIIPVWPIPKHYLIGLLSLIPLALLAWGTHKHKWLNTFWETGINLKNTSFLSIKSAINYAFDLIPKWLFYDFLK